MTKSQLFLKDKPTLHDLQVYVRQLEQERGFTKDEVVAKCLLLVEEVGELFKCIRKSHTTLGMDVKNKTTHDLSGEFADILIVLTTIANRLNIDLEQAFRDKEEKNKLRTWR